MAKLAIKKGSADVTVYLFAQDSSKTTGEGLTGLAYNTASLTAYYVRPLGSATQISLASLAAVDSNHTDGGFKEVSSTNMPGVYRLDLPDAVCASGAPSAVVMLKGAANLAPVLLELQLLTNDPNDIATETTAAAIKAKTDNLPASPAAVGSAMTLTSAYDKAKDDVLTPLAAAKSVVDAVKAKTDNLPASPAAVGSAMTLTSAYDAAKSASSQTSVNAVKAKTDNLPASPAAVGSAMTLTSAYDAAKNAASQASVNAIPTTPLLAANYTAPDNAGISAIKAKTDNLPATPANEATLTAIKGAGWTNETLTAIDGLIDAIKAKTDNLPAQPAAKSDVPTKSDIRDAVGLATANLDAQLAAIQGDLDNPAQYKADISGLAKTTDLNGLAKTTDLSGLATEANATSNKSAIITAIDNKPVTPVTDISTLATKTDVSGIPDALLSKVVVGTFTFQQILKIYAAIETGTVAGGGSASFTYTGKDGTTVTLSGVDENGNRTLVSVNFGA